MVDLKVAYSGTWKAANSVEYWDLTKAAYSAASKGGWKAGSTAALKVGSRAARMAASTDAHSVEY